MGGGSGNGRERRVGRVVREGKWEEMEKGGKGGREWSSKGGREVSMVARRPGIPGFEPCCPRPGKTLPVRINIPYFA
jgi:hypothetical protein